MALINCPECGKEISDRAVQCPNCGCPINSTVGRKVPESAPLGKDVTYFDGVVGRVRCYLSSTMWMFGRLSIPVDNVLTAYLFRREFPRGIKIAMTVLASLGVLSVLFICLHGAIGLFELLVLLLIFGGGLLTLFIIGKSKKCEGLEMISNFGLKTSVIKSRKHLDNLEILEEAAIRCLKENSQRNR